jgi:hypoxanthine phosphoribosyltransferase
MPSMLEDMQTLANIELGPIVKRPRVIKIGWPEINLMVDILTEMLGEKQITDIIGIHRGGLIPATMISHRTRANLHILSARSYDDAHNQKEGVTLSYGKHLLHLPEDTTVIIDDVVDSGATYEAVKHHGFTYRYGALLSKAADQFKCCYVMQVPKDVWVQFPWEID